MGKNLKIIGNIYRMMLKMFLILSRIYSFTFFMKLLCEINRNRVAILNIRLIRAMGLTLKF